MSWQLVWVLVLLASAIVMFAIGKPRMDVVAVIMIVALPLTGVLTVPETLAGFADPNVVLIAALFVVGEGLSRTGITYRLGDWLARTAGSSAPRLIVLLMITAALLGAFMSSTGVVAIFIPVVLSIAARTGMSPSQLMMPLSFAGLISGMLTLIATAPNLIVDAELVRHGASGFGFFSFTPFGLAILVLGVGYMVLTRRFLGGDAAAGAGRSRRTFLSLIEDYGVSARTHRYRVGRRSPLAGTDLAGVDLDGHGGGILVIERTRLLGRTVRTTADDARIAADDILIADAAISPDRTRELVLEELPMAEDFFASYSRQIGMAEVIVTPTSSVLGKSVRDLAFRSAHDLSVLGVRHAGHAAPESYPVQRLRAGDTMLVTGAWSAIHRLQGVTHDFVVLDLPAEVDEVAPAANRAPLALLSLAAMVVMMVTGVVPNVIAALIACLLLGLFRCVDMVSAYRSIHWPTILLIVGMLPFADALQKTGGVDLIVDGLLGVVGAAGPTVILAAIFALTAIIGLFVSNTATAVLMAPIAIATAQHLGLSPYPFAMIVALAASSAFITPVSSPVNTLVVEPGRYRFFDFVRVGAPFTLVVMVVSVLLVPVVLPL